MFGKLISDLKFAQEEIATAGMMRPKADPFEHGVQAGKYQGVQLALDIIENILRDENEKELSA